MDATQVYPFAVGTLQYIALNDGSSIIPIDNIVQGVPPEQWKQTLLDSGCSAAETTFGYNCLYIDTGQHHVLVDAGMGQDVKQRDEALIAKYKLTLPHIERNGTLVDHLQAASVAAKDIDRLIITHGDGDHIGGITNPDGQFVFPHASYVLSKEAWDFWSNEALVAQWPEFLTAAGRKIFPLIRERVQVVEAGIEFLPGFRFISAPGHRPGHSALEICSQGERLFHIADTVGHRIFMEHPSWPWYVDSRHDQAERDRVHLLSQAATQRALIFGSHLPFPGVGYVKERDVGWHWQPLTEASNTPC
jgi:glyoxylase-like metal-dependent hydrolase (beta-lactamase superfamily II)